MPRQRAFTLVELLVVIAIIAILIAILLPVVKKVKRQVEKTMCVSNLRQIAAALLGYSIDNKGKLPIIREYLSPEWGVKHGTSEDWLHWQPGRDITQSALWPYLNKSRKVLVCPSGIPDRRPEYIYPFSYALNDILWGVGGKLSRVVQPWHKLMVAEMDSLTINDAACGFGRGHSDWPYPPWLRPGEPTNWLSVRHFTLRKASTART